ncbi:MAG: flagellar hook-basal body complex protein FliE [Spirochaetia bacterium]|nr:flagellar hook-basal body complex protein FliE [Spirochaetia bacterium]
MTIPFALSGIEGIVSSIGMPQSILTNEAMQPQAPDTTGRADFNDILNMAVKAVSDTQIGADDAIAKLASGQDIELHNVMLAVQEASMTLDLALQVKNKITDAYQSIMSMQI